MLERNKHVMECALVTWFYTKLLVGTLLVFLVLNFFWGEHVLLSFSDLLGSGTEHGRALQQVWFVFAWAAVSAYLITRVFIEPNWWDDSPLEALAKGSYSSVLGGIVEELVYRWLVFFCFMVLLPFFNLITFGLVRWVFVTILIPVANWATFHALEPQLLHGASWVLGAAILAASGRYRQNSAFQGWYGVVAAWFLSMMLFYVMFNYGIGTAMVVHILYCLCWQIGNALALKQLDYL